MSDSLLEADAASPKHHCSQETASNPLPRPARFSFQSLRPSFTRTSPTSRSSSPFLKQTPHICHQAKVCYVVMTGSIPPGEPTKAVKGKKRSPFGDKTNSSLNLVETSPTTEKEQVREEDIEQLKVVAKPKAVKKLKSDLLKPEKARVIVGDLKRMDEPVERGSATNTPCRAYSLDDSRSPSFGIVNFSTLSIPTTGGGILGIASSKTGAFEVLADVSGTLVRKSGARDGSNFTAPFDSVGLFLYWWGYEISLPPVVLSKLSAVHSVQQTFFGFLQAFVVAGGAPELAPFIRYISNYIDMEFTAIQSQNKGGKGVVLAATWLLPVALVPRPWDFPLSETQQAASPVKSREAFNRPTVLVPLQI
ncbi:hypothetical protein JCM5350_006480 [Sporobolomyces pararoseus]